MLKKSIRKLMFLMASALVSLSMAAANAKTITFVTDKEKDGGFLIEVTRAAFAKVGHEIKIEYRPWARALGNVMNGTSEALLGVYYTAERAEAMLYTDLIGRSDMVFFKLKTTQIVYDKLEDLKPYSVGTIIGAAYTPEFDSAQFFRKEAVSDHIQNIRKLLGGRFELFVEKKFVVLNTLKTQFPEDYARVDYLPKPLRENVYYNAFSRQYPDYEKTVADFNKGLKMIIDDGTFDAIMKKELHE